MTPFRAAILATICLTAAARAEVRPDGSYAHVIPINVPRGAGNSTPAIALAYDSHGADGLAGPGFTLSGLPVITRGAYDDAVRYAAHDTFYGPSGRLIALAGGSYYHAENEDWGKYVASGVCGVGPCSWTLYDKQGGVWSFGATTDSRIVALDHGGAVRVWALNHYQDPSGNGYDVTYLPADATGAYYPSQIVYGLGPGIGQWRTIDFAYEPRPAHAPIWDQGAMVDVAERLHSIRVSADGQLVRELDLGYDPDGHLQRLSQLGSDDISRLPDQTFSWNQRPNFALTPSPSSNVPNFGAGGWSGDLNGDGRLDVAFHDGRNYWLHLKLSTPSGGYVDVSRQVAATQWGDDMLTGVADFDGDGIADVLSATRGDTGVNVYLYHGSTSGSLSLTTFSVPGNNDMDRGGYFWTGDFDGDGKSDFATKTSDGNVIVFLAYNGSFLAQTWAYGGAWGASSLTSVGDFDGDGRSNLITVTNGQVVVLRSTGVGFTPITTGTPLSAPDTTNTFTGDFNGDGKTDLVFAAPIAGQNTYQLTLLLSTGSGFYRTGSSIQTLFGAQNLVGDFDGDGKSDVLSMGVPTVSWLPTQPRTILHTFNGTQPINRYAAYGLTPASALVLAGDTDGDGITDALIVDPATSNMYSARPPTFIDALFAVNNGMGGSIELFYAPSVQLPGAIDNNAYTCLGVSSTNAWRCGNPDRRSRPVVTQEQRRDGGEGLHQLFYSYGNGRVLPGSLATRTDLGFESFIVKDGATGQTQEAWFYQAKPFQRSERQQRTWVPGSGGAQLELERIDSALPTQVACGESGCVADASVQTASPRLLVPTMRSTTESEMGSLLYSVVETITADGYGNAKQLRQTARDRSGNIMYDEFRYSDVVNQLSPTRAIGLAYQARYCADAACSDPIDWTRTYYDAQALGVAGARLVPTRSERWMGGTTFAATVRTFDANGNVATETAPNGLITTFDYSDDPFRANVTRKIDPVIGEIDYHYDQRYDTADQATWATGHGESYDRDAFGRVVDKRVEEVTAGTTPTRTTVARTHTTYNWSSTGIAQQECKMFRADGDPADAMHWTGSLCVSTSYDGRGRKASQTSPSGSGPATVQWTYDAAEREQTISEPSQGAPSYFSTLAYDAAGRVSSIMLPDGNTRSNTYNGEAPVAGAVTVAMQVNGRGFQHVEHRDAHGHLIRVVEGRGQFCPGSAASATATGGVIKSALTITPIPICIYNYGAYTSYAYDAKGRLATITTPDGGASTITYDSAGRRASFTDPSRGTTTWTYWDVLGQSSYGQVKDETRLDPNATSGTVTSHYDYDSKGRIAKRTDSDGSTLVMIWDETDVPHGAGRITTMHLTSGGYDVVERHGYDPRGAQSDLWRTITTGGITLASSHVTTLTDEIGRPRTITHPDGSVLTLAYDAQGGRAKSAALDGVTQVSWPAFTVRNQPTDVYYANGLHSSITYSPSNGLPVVTGTMDPTGKGMLNNGYDYDGDYNISAAYDYKQSGLTTTYGYDTFGRLTSAARADGKKLSFAYSGDGDLVVKSGFDALGNVVTRNRDLVAGTDRLADDGAGTTLSWSGSGALLSAGGNAYQYDAHNLLRVVNVGGQKAEQLVYGPGNDRLLRIEYQADGSAVRTYSLAPTYEVMERVVAGAVTQRTATRIVPGADGNRAAEVTVALPTTGPAGAALASLSGVPHGVAFGWLGLGLAGLASLGLGGPGGRRRRRAIDLRSRLVRVVPAALYIFVAQGCGGVPTAETAAALAGDVAVTPVGSRYYSGDLLGSAALVTDGSGNEIVRLHYAPYGETDPANSGKWNGSTYDKTAQMPRVGFTGQGFDRRVGLYDFHARQYDPVLGIFTTPDSVIPDVSSPSTLNPYAYARGNPERYTDPSGHFPLLAAIFIGMALGAITFGTHGQVWTHPMGTDTWANWSWRDAGIGAAVGAAAGASWWAAGEYIGGTLGGTKLGALFQAGISNAASTTAASALTGQSDPMRLGAIFGVAFVDGFFERCTFGLGGRGLWPAVLGHSVAASLVDSLQNGVTVIHTPFFVDVIEQSQELRFHDDWSSITFWLSAASATGTALTERDHGDYPGPFSGVRVDAASYEGRLGIFSVTFDTVMESVGRSYQYDGDHRGWWGQNKVAPLGAYYGVARSLTNFLPLLFDL